MFYILKREVTEQIAGYDFIRWHDARYYEQKDRAQFKMANILKFYLSIGYWKTEKEWANEVLLQATDNDQKKMTIKIEEVDYD